MIIVTGPGRSGTSVLAQLYQQLGFDPGGRWIPKVNAGFEHGEFWRLNNALAAGVGVSMLRLPAPVPASSRTAPSSPPTGYRRVVRGAKRRVVKALSEPPAQPAAGGPKGGINANGRARMIDWRRVPAVVEKYGPEMVRLSKETPFVKDPRFIWTLPMWIAAGAEIEHITITTRAMDEMVASRHAAGHSKFSEVELRNTLTYGLGVVSAAVYESGVSHSFIRFPDFLHDLDALYAALRFPSPVDLDHFRETAAKLFDFDQVHWSGTTPVAQ